LLTCRVVPVPRAAPASLLPYTTLFRSKLRHKQHELDDALAACHEPTARQELEEKISILAAQRRKGLELLRELNDSPAANDKPARSEEHTSELQSREKLVCHLLLENKKR